jgi:tryptophan-rich sensory protein
MRMPTLLKTSLAVTAAALAGSVATASGMRWYDRLDKPRWQPPKQAFGLVWTPLYGLVAVAGARALDRLGDDRRPAFARAYAANLALNGAWTPLFFGARAPRLALAEIAALNASNVDLLRRAWRADRVAGACLAPYVAWTGFATALNAAIVRRNPAAGGADPR